MKIPFCLYAPFDTFWYLWHSVLCNKYTYILGNVNIVYILWCKYISLKIHLYIFICLKRRCRLTFNSTKKMQKLVVVLISGSNVILRVRFKSIKKSESFTNFLGTGSLSTLVGPGSPCLNMPSLILKCNGV